MPEHTTPFTLKRAEYYCSGRNNHTMFSPSAENIANSAENSKLYAIIINRI